MVKVGIPTVMKALSYVGPRREMPFRASQLVIWLLVCLALTAAVFFLALRLLFPEVSESIFW
jgi:uncharacterized membrane protein YGL010W